MFLRDFSLLIMHAHTLRHSEARQKLSIEAQTHAAIKAFFSFVFRVKDEERKNIRRHEAFMTSHKNLIKQIKSFEKGSEAFIARILMVLHLNEGV